MNDIDNNYGEKLRNSIIIGGLEEEQQLLLVPFPKDNWECWHFSANPANEIGLYPRQFDYN